MRLWALLLLAVAACSANEPVPPEPQPEPPQATAQTGMMGKYELTPHVRAYSASVTEADTTASVRVTLSPRTERLVYVDYITADVYAVSAYGTDLVLNHLPTFSYGPSKAAIHHLARTLATHLADKHITVNAIAPGLFPSKMTAATIDAMGEKIRLGTPLKRHGKPEDMVGIAIYLASPAASFVTGVIIPVDGGITGAKPTL